MAAPAAPLTTAAPCETAADAAPVAALVATAPITALVVPLSSAEDTEGVVGAVAAVATDTGVTPVFAAALLVAATAADGCEGN